MTKKVKSAVNKQNINLIGKSREEVTEILGTHYIFYKDEGGIIYYIKYLFFFKRRVFVGFDENDIVDTTISL